MRGHLSKPDALDPQKQGAQNDSLGRKMAFEIKILIGTEPRDQCMSLARVAREINTKGFMTLRAGEFTDGTVLALLRRVSEG